MEGIIVVASITTNSCATYSHWFYHSVKIVRYSCGHIFGRLFPLDTLSMFMGLRGTSNTKLEGLNSHLAYSALL